VECCSGNYVTVNELVFVPYCPSVLVTTTFHDPAVAPVRSNVQVIFDEDTTVTSVPAIFGYPDRVRFTFAPGWNPVPARLVIGTGEPWVADAGVMELTVGFGLLTLTVYFVINPDCPSGLITATRYAVLTGAPSRL